MPFITFEGIDGSGKSTQARLLSRHLEGHGKSLVSTREPWGGQLGRSVRELLTDAPLSSALSPVEEMLLICAARYDHVRSVITPALEEGRWVICDRFQDATYAYQIYRQIPEELAEALSRLVCGEAIPDITFILDIEPGAARTRLEGRVSGSADPAEATRDFARIRDGFKVAAANDPKRCFVIDGSQSETKVAAEIVSVLRARKLLT